MAVHAHAGTLVAATVARVDISTWMYGIWLQNRDTTADIWVRLDGVDPAAEADDSFLVRAGDARNFATGNGVVTVRLISAGTPSYALSGSVPATVVTS